MNTEIAAALIFVLLFSSLAVLLFSWKSRDDNRSSRESPSDSKDFHEILETSSCPLCGEPLPPGEKVHSVLFPGKEFGLMRIYGCTNFWSGHPRARETGTRYKRRCPSCGESLPDSGYVMARVYDKENRKTHVQVYGCTLCQIGRG